MRAQKGPPIPILARSVMVCQATPVLNRVGAMMGRGGVPADREKFSFLGIGPFGTANLKNIRLHSYCPSGEEIYSG